MTKQSHTAVTMERLAQLLDAYGGEPARWPAAERDLALQLIAASPEAQRLQREALALDGALELAELPDASNALRARVLEIPVRHPRAASASHTWRFGWKLALFALTPCVIGFLSGTLLPDMNGDADDETWDELALVVMPATMPDELDLFDAADEAAP